MTRRPMTADKTAPNEKKTERAVTRYCFPLGICSKRSVPSVGIETWYTMSNHAINSGED